MHRIAVVATVTILAVLTSCTTPTPMEQPPSELRGKGSLSFTYAPLADKPIVLHYYVPSNATPTSPIVISCHGASRTASNYRDRWVEKADEYGLVIVAPEFTEELYPGSEYALGNVYSHVDGLPQLNDAELWTFSTIEPIFDEVKRLTGNHTTEYYLFGHSAGGQFVHRLVLWLPDARYAVAVAANAGWYTVPTETVDYPYGIGLTPLAETAFGFFGKRLVITIGELDNDPDHPQLRRTPEALQQGENRYERAHHFFDQSRAKAAALGVEFEWSIVDVPNVAHSGSRMARHAADYLFGG